MKSVREPAWRELKIGLIALAAVGFVVLLIVKVDRNEGLFTKAAVVRSHLTDLKGLRIGAPVQLSGVEVGNVKEIQFQKDGSVIVTMTIRKDLRGLLRKSSWLHRCHHQCPQYHHLGKMYLLDLLHHKSQSGWCSWCGCQKHP